MPERSISAAGRALQRTVRPHGRLLSRGRILLAALLGALPLTGTDESARTLSMKGAFVVNFIHFIEWSQQAESGPIEIVLVGDDEAIEVVTAVLHERGGDGSRFRLTHAHSLDEVDSGDLVYYLGEEAIFDASDLTRLHDSGAVTVGDAEGFIEAGGTIQFVLAQNRLRFRINNEQAHEDGQYHISSKLLNLAVP